MGKYNDTTSRVAEGKARISFKCNGCKTNRLVDLAPNPSIVQCPSCDEVFERSDPDNEAMFSEIDRRIGLQVRAHEATTRTEHGKSSGHSST